MRTKWQPRDWQSIFTNPTSFRGLVYKIYKELNKLDNNNPNNSMNIWCTILAGLPCQSSVVEDEFLL